MTRYRTEDLWILMVAAGSSPLVRHRWASVAHLVSYIAHQNETGAKQVDPRHLAQLLDRCYEDEPSLVGFEDFLPEDPRDVVAVRLGDRTVRLFPGCVERPVADLDRALLVAAAVDDLVISRMGFGIRDLVDVAFGFMDAAIGLMEPAWPKGELDEDAPAAVTDAEMAAATTLSGWDLPPSLAITHAQQLALEWVTCDASDLRYEPTSSQSVFGRFMRLRTSAGHVSWLPLAFIPEIFNEAIDQLAGEAAQVRGANRRFAQSVAVEVRRRLWQFGLVVLGPDSRATGPVVSSRDTVQWVCQLTPGRVVLVEIFARLQMAELPFDGQPEAARAAEATAAHPTSPVEVAMPGGRMLLRSATEAVPLLVVATASHIRAPQLPRLPGMALEDLQWAATTADATSDLFTYCRDMSRVDFPEFFGWEAINMWEWWRANGKSFFTAGRAPDFVYFTPHAGTAEWQRAAQNSDLERALAQLRLPALREVDGVDMDSSDPRSVYRYESLSSRTPEGAFGQRRESEHPRPSVHGWTIHVGEIPVGISAIRPDWPDPFVDLLHDLSGAFAFALRAIDGVWGEAHKGHEIAGYVVELAHRAGRDDGLLMWWSDLTRTPTSDGLLLSAKLVVATDALLRTPDADHVVQNEMAKSFAALLEQSGVPDPQRTTVAQAWLAAPPTLTVQAMRSPTTRHNLAGPIRLDEAHVSLIERRVAESVRAAGVAPGDYLGQEAKDLERVVLAPAALAELNAALARHDMDDVVRFGMRELERCLDERDIKLRNLRHTASRLQIDWDPVERYNKMQADYLLLRRCNETAVEAALRLAPTGDQPLDSLGWGEILGAARAYLDATMRSEGIHHQVSPTVLRVSESWELSTTRDSVGASEPTSGLGRVYDLDTSEFSRSRAVELFDAEADTLPDQDLRADQLDPFEHGAPEQVAPSESGPLLDSRLDEALSATWGASGSDVLITLFGLATWPLTDRDDDVVKVAREALANYVLEATILGDDVDARDRVNAAVQLLTSTSTDLAASDWKPWHARSRKKRILIQPLAQLSDGELLLAPHLCLASLSAYRGYMEQGQLPWSQPESPRRVEAALEKIRADRNRELEQTVANTLRAAGWTVIENIKPSDPGRLNVPVLQTEIDVVAGRPGTRDIWLLEVKDPVDVFVIPDIRRALDRFFVDTNKPSYATQLQRKYEDLRPYARHVAAALNLPTDPEMTYIIRPIFVTRAPAPAAFVSSTFNFTTLGGLLETLAATHDAPGNEASTAFS